MSSTQKDKLKKTNLYIQGILKYYSSQKKWVRLHPVKVQEGKYKQQFLKDSNLMKQTKRGSPNKATTYSKDKEVPANWIGKGEGP